MVRSAIVRVRLNQDEKAALTGLCDQARTESEVVRLLLRDYAGLPLPVAPVDGPALKRNMEELRRIGINLNQAVRAMNEGRVGYEPQLAAVLKTLLGGVSSLRADIDRLLKLEPGRLRRVNDGL